MTRARLDVPPRIPTPAPPRVRPPHVRWRTWLTALPLLFAASVTAAAPPMVSVAGSHINLRSGPGTESRIEWTLTRGYPLQVIGQRRGWLKVRDFESDTGWVLGRLTGRTPHVIVQVPVAKLRSAAGTTHRVIGRAQYGDVLRTLDRRGGWLRVRADGGRAGWIAKRLVWGF